MLYSLVAKLFASKISIHELSDADTTTFNSFLKKNKEPQITFDNYRTYFIAETVVNKGICGYVMLHRNNIKTKDFCILYSLMVNKMKRRQHIGNSLVKAVIERAKKENYSQVFVSTSIDNIAAQRLYTKLGFTPYLEMSSNPAYENEIKSYLPKEMRGFILILN